MKANEQMRLPTQTAAISSHITEVWADSQVCDVDRLRLAVAETGAPHLTARRDRDGVVRVVWVNDALLELVGMEPDDLVGCELTTGRPAPTPVVAESGDWWTAAAAGLAGQDAWRTASVKRPDRSLVVVHVRVIPVDGLGWVVRLESVGDGREAAEERCQEAEHRFKALAEHAPIGIVVSEAGVRLGYVNDQFARIAGVDRSLLLGNRWFDVIAPEDVPALRDGLSRVLSGAAVEQTVRVQTLAESPRWALFRFAPVTTPRGASGFIASVEDITSRRAWEAQLTYQARHDPLTGLANRRYLVETLNDLLTSHRHRDHQFAVLFADLDGFKAVNDTLGHDAGDGVLVEVARRMSATARGHDLVARVAGDEFVVVLREIRDEAEAEAAAKRQGHALRAPIAVGERSVQISASIGVVMARKQDTPASLLRAADDGMYQAKSTGPGAYRLVNAGDTAAPGRP